jgi:hypothetical protein
LLSHLAKANQILCSDVLEAQLPPTHSSACQNRVYIGSRRRQHSTLASIDQELRTFPSSPSQPWTRQISTNKGYWRCTENRRFFSTSFRLLFEYLAENNAIPDKLRGVVGQLRVWAENVGAHHTSSSEVERFEEERPDTQCANCSRWGHVESHCDVPERIRCSLCAEKHKTDQHKCQVVDCTRGAGQQCLHVIIKCPYCKGPHLCWSKACPAKQRAMEEARGWHRQEHRRQVHTAQPPAVTNADSVQSAVQAEPTEHTRNEALEAITAPEVLPGPRDDVMADE